MSALFIVNLQDSVARIRRQACVKQALAIGLTFWLVRVQSALAWKVYLEANSFHA